MGATSLKLPDELKKRIQALVSGTDQTVHAFMVNAIARETERGELRRRFGEEARQAEEDKVVRQGLRCGDGAIQLHLRARASGKKTRRPRAKTATLKLTERAHDDLERIFEFIARTDPGRALSTIESIEDAVKVLERHPLIGRRAEEGRRELVISRGRNRYVALYRWFEAEELALILAIRSAREAGQRD